MLDLYSNPRYYEIAFSFRDIGQEIDVFEECFHRYSKIPVRRVLELGCGPSPHIGEFARRGYEYAGLDINEHMLDYAGQKAKELGAAATFIRADMRHFSLENPADFVYVMLGSLYAQTTDDLLSHFAAVAQALTPGGLYLLDWCINFQWDTTSTHKQRWTIEKNGVTIDAEYMIEDVVDRAAQTYRDKLVVDVNDHGKTRRLESVEVRRNIFPQEFLLLAEKSGEFEFIGWWNNWNLDEPVERAEHIDRPITVLRRL
jgi:SAM-dependent methyltransferase